MVTRKPLPASSTVLPYVAPLINMEDKREDTTASAKPEVIPEQHADQAADSDADSWERDTDSDDDEEPPALPYDEAGWGNTTAGNDSGSTAGAGNGGFRPVTPAVTGESDGHLSQTPGSARSGAGPETNPFRRKMSQSSALNSGFIPPIPSTPAPPIPSTPAPLLPPFEDFSKLTLNDASKNPWQPALDEQRSLAPSTLSTAADQEPVQDPWRSQASSRAPSIAQASERPAIQSLAPEEKGGWGDENPGKPSIAVPPSFQISVENQELEKDRHAWDDVAASDKGKAPMKRPPIPGTSASNAPEGGISLIDLDDTPASKSVGEPSQNATQPAGEAPDLPPRYSSGKEPAVPQRTPAPGKTETYQVRNINWHDANSGKVLRNSPILIQNANGPCPLMALVNALTLTTPANAEDAVLVNTLKTREQISLDLLLDAVFDELMSDRRTTPDQSLPDVTELYAFLKGLHTGMNVNPRFVPTEETEKQFKRTSLTHLHPTERGDLIPGTFEDTKEMSFYRIFQIPLIHGWLPQRDDPVYEALKRQAESYEDTQNLLFREEELDDKLSSPTSQGLSDEEQGIYQDILSIKSFLHTSATQLTPWGLEVIIKAMRPGSVAILFRNDHFSTLYRHPETLQLYSLVTDAGYASHDEIVWESLVDVNGEREEFFSGDFRVVSSSPQANEDAGSASASAPNGQEWTTVGEKKEKNKIQEEVLPISPEEQEDRDLALALQLQEEEDQRHRAEQAQRRREAQLSEQFIEQQAAGRGPVNPRQASISASAVAPGRRTSSVRGSVSSGRSGPAPAPAPAPVPPPRPAAAAQQQVRPLVPPAVRPQVVSRPADDVDDDAPPSYEDAARQTAYVPPAGHPSHPYSSPTPSSSTLRLSGNTTARASPSGVSAAAASAAAAPSPLLLSPPGGMRRPSGYRQGVPPSPSAGGSIGSRDKDCVVM